MKRESILKPRSARWQGYGRLSTVPIVVSIMMTALFLQGCVTSRKASEAREKTETVASIQDSTAIETRLVKTIPLEAEEARLEISMDSLARLPEGATYIARQGRTEARVKRQGGKIEVTATSDSTAAIVEYYERRTTTANAARGEQTSESERTTKERRSNGVKTYLLCAIIGAMAVIITVITKKKRKKQ